jgi:RiboL-PSP-HEPN
MSTVIDALYQQNREALTVVSDAQEVSIASDLDNKLKKHLIMAAASYFETEIRNAIEDFAANASRNNPAIIALIKNKALERQYHTYFAWETRNANRFFSHFGEPFNTRCREDIKGRQDLAEAASAFLELGEMRNKLAHLNFALFPIEKTSEEIYGLYQRAHTFLDYVRESLQAACVVEGSLATDPRRADPGQN